MTNYWEQGDLYTIIIDWVAARQRDGSLSEDWVSVYTYDGSKIIALRRPGNVRTAGEPYITIYHNSYEAHNYVDYKLGFVEITGHCNAANPQFFDILLDDMIGIQTAEAMQSLEDNSDERSGS